MYHKHSFTVLPLDTIEKMRRKEANRPGNVSSLMPVNTMAICYSSTYTYRFIVTLNESYTSTCISQWCGTCPIHCPHTHKHTHSPTCTHTVLPEGDCKTEKRVERLTPLFPSRPARPIFKMLMPGAQTHSVQFIWSFSRKTLWSLKQLN